jgi:hypothetical protein
MFCLVRIQIVLIQHKNCTCMIFALLKMLSYYSIPLWNTWFGLVRENLVEYSSLLAFEFDSPLMFKTYDLAYQLLLTVVFAFI